MTCTAAVTASHSSKHDAGQAKQTHAAQPETHQEAREAHSVMGVATKAGQILTTLIFPKRASAIASLNLRGRVTQHAIQQLGLYLQRLPMHVVGAYRQRARTAHA